MSNNPLNNPYAASYTDPRSYSDTPMQRSSGSKNIASGGQRFGTFVVDNLALGLLQLLNGGLIALVCFYGLNGDFNFLIAITVFNAVNVLMFFVYYIVLESTTSKTFGKMAIGTKVISASGGRPSTGQIIGRTFCRLIPFEPFSFFVNLSNPVSWHDRFSGTRVVSTR